jgi:gliding motility-associated-like protein
LYPNAQIKVFDRTGRLVFESDGGYENDWDGSFDGKPLPLDTYYYIIDFNSEELEPVKGTVTIVR